MSNLQLLCFSTQTRRPFPSGKLTCQEVKGVQVRDSNKKLMGCSEGVSTVPVVTLAGQHTGQGVPKDAAGSGAVPCGWLLEPVSSAGLTVPCLLCPKWTETKAPKDRDPEVPKISLLFTHRGSQLGPQSQQSSSSSSSSGVLLMVHIITLCEDIRHALCGWLALWMNKFFCGDLDSRNPIWDTKNSLM